MPEPVRTSLYELVDQTLTQGDVEETFVAGELTGSPWSSQAQHGGPVAALLTRAMDRCSPRDDMRLARVTVEMLGAVPIVDVRVAAFIERPGRRVQLVAARLEFRRPDGTWQSAAYARGWRLLTSDTIAVRHDAEVPLPLPTAEATRQWDVHPVPAQLHTSAFVNALEWRFTAPTREPGVPTTAWMRLTCPLVSGEDPTPLEQAVAIADVANGIGARLDPDAFSFPNTDLSVHLYQPPSGSWYGLAAETSVGTDGIGMSAATLYDVTGPLGRVAQTVLVQPRQPHHR